MAISVFELFTIGIGPSSSHTVGPMRAAKSFVDQLQQQQLLEKTHSVAAKLYGSLGATGRGHGSDKAVIGGLTGETPETVDPDALLKQVDTIRESCRLPLAGKLEIEFDLDKHLEFSGCRT